MQTAAVDLKAEGAQVFTAEDLREGVVSHRPGVRHRVSNAGTNQSRKPPAVLKLRLTDDRTVRVNGQTVAMPVGVGNRVTGAALKELADVYRGHSLFLGHNGSATRVRDDDVVELTNDAEITSREESVSQPAHSRD